MTGNSQFNQRLLDADGNIVDESSIMVSGMVALAIEYNGLPIWISQDLNSKQAFRPLRNKMEVRISVKK